MSNRFPTTKNSVSNSAGLSDALSPGNLEFQRLLNNRSNADFYNLVNRKSYRGGANAFVMNMRSGFRYTTARVPNGAVQTVRVAMYMYELAGELSQPVVNYDGWIRESACPVGIESLTFSNVLACTVANSAAYDLPLGSPAPSVYTRYLNLWGNIRPNINNNLIHDNNGRFTRAVPSHLRTPRWYRWEGEWSWPMWLNNNPVPGLLPQPFVTVTPPFVVIPGITNVTDPSVLPESHSGPTPRSVVDKKGPPDPPGPKPGKEKKFRFWGTVHGIQKIWHATTEGLDFLECIWKALPKQYRTKPRHRLGDYADVGAQIFNPNALVALPQEKFADLVRNWDKINWGRRYEPGEIYGWEKDANGDWQPKVVAPGDYHFTGAIKCLVINHFTDEVIGRIAGGAATEASRRNVILGLFL